MNSKFLTALVAGILGIVATFAAPAAWADDPRFSLSSGFDNSADKYETGPWMFKLTAPAGLLATKNTNPDMAHLGTGGQASNTSSRIGDTEAAASYNLYPGSASSPEINLTGKVKVYGADKYTEFGLSQNDYAAQMDVYQNLDKFTAKGTLGSIMLGSQTGLTLNPLLYGSFGGVYQFSEKTSTGIDMSLSQGSPATGVMQHEVSAFVNYKLDDHFKARGYVLRGISNGTPSNAVGGQVYYGF
jgi:hypothetical protein